MPELINRDTQRREPNAELDVDDMKFPSLMAATQGPTASDAGERGCSQGNKRNGR